MILDSGTMYICTLYNANPNGRMPKETLKPIAKHWYQERVIGLNRRYLAMGANERIDLLVYIHDDRRVKSGMFAVLGNGEQFRIDEVNFVIEENTNLRFTSMQMHRLDENYDVYYPTIETSEDRDGTDSDQQS